MDYKLFEEFITLQALLKDLGIIQSGGAIKSFLAEETVLLNGEDEKRRGKKIRIGDVVELPNQGISITLAKPSVQEVAEYQKEKTEKERVAAIVKNLNKKVKKANKTQKEVKKAPIRFPGT
ncbi:S4 domain-containing protein YaaA [Streptococcus merionis]|uniref:Cytoplasmic protein n=1 Tax=Streptococcus merionis TaxID=400065 RepID=A0A239SY09_9STRE|nr:S4 domain-containing protein YaaA [Streptococcus merionis]SNU90360.1 cytoplasmic protein [Streptococcus merionis]